ncbi:MAG TPA: tetratricopeptide repeat protein [Candidatus Saccharimonadales bacterium]|nr:tetratricopeptide repeat protein [Candidatus Saccharimonadales bacterium]
MDATPIAKILPRSPTDGLIERPALEQLAATARNRRLTVVVAEAGFGKSTLLASWWESTPCAWYTADQHDLDLPTLGRQLSDALRLRVPDIPSDVSWLAEGAGGPELEQFLRADALAAQLAEILHAQLSSDLILVIDDAHELAAASPSARLVEALCRHAPPRLHLVISGRRQPPFQIERLRGQGQLLEIDGGQLAFTVEEVGELVQRQLGLAAENLAAQIHRIAGGWPAAVTLAIEALKSSPRETWATVFAALDKPNAPLYSYLAEEVFARHPDAVRDLISKLALFDRFTPELCEAIGIAGSGAMLGELTRQGLFVERGPDGSLALRPLIRDYARESLPVAEAVALDLRATAGHWLAANGASADAIQVLLSSGASDELARVVTKEGARLLAAGQIATVLRACRAIPPATRSAEIEQLEGEAQQIQGDWSEAMACFQRAAAGRTSLPAHLAWRMGLIHYLRGEHEEALAVYQRGVDDRGADPMEMALLLAWMSTAHWIRGDVEPCRELAGRALAAANACGDHRALAAAHTVMAMLAALDGDRRANDAHYLLALRAAEEASDVLQVVRIRTNRGSHFLEEGSYPEALQELDVAVRLAELTSFASFLALSLSNRGETKLRMGRIDDALTDLEASRLRYRQIDSDMVAYPLTLIGEIHSERGNLAQARVLLEESLEIAEQSGDVQGVVPALACLAVVVAGEDPERARALADRAVSYGTGMAYVIALLAAGWVAAAAGDRMSARELASQAEAVARARHDRPGLADALALTAVTAEDQRVASRRLAEAGAIWQEIGNPLGEAKVNLILASIDEGTGSAALRRKAEHQLEALGVRAHQSGNVAAGLLTFLSPLDRVAVRVQSLGGFSVFRDGELVRVSEWQSKRARELLKLLIARRGRPAPRGYLMETLWPGEDPDRVANRLSVALTTVRGVLDPQRRFPPEHFVLADKDAVALNLDAVDVDVERFLSAAAEGLGSVRRGDIARGLPILSTATVRYAGDFLEENPYDDWATPLREEARGVYVGALRMLARHAADPDIAVTHLLRILEMDRYDEQAHLGLVSALAGSGRHGEAHRHYLNYRRAMDDLGVEPAPFPAGRGGRAPETDPMWRAAGQP